METTTCEGRFNASPNGRFDACGVPEMGRADTLSYALSALVAQQRIVTKDAPLDPFSSQRAGQTEAQLRLFSRHLAPQRTSERTRHRSGLHDAPHTSFTGMASTTQEPTRNLHGLHTQQRHKGSKTFRKLNGQTVCEDRTQSHRPRRTLVVRWTPKMSRDFKQARRGS